MDDISPTCWVFLVRTAATLSCTCRATHIDRRHTPRMTRREVRRRVDGDPPETKQTSGSIAEVRRMPGRRRDVAKVRRAERGGSEGVVGKRKRRDVFRI